MPEWLFNRFSIRMLPEHVESIAQPGQAEPAVTLAMQSRHVFRQFGGISSGDIRDELREYGAWSEEDLQNDADNRARIVWIAACNLHEEFADAKQRLDAGKQARYEYENDL